MDLNQGQDKQMRNLDTSHLAKEGQMDYYRLQTG